MEVTWGIVSGNRADVAEKTYLETNRLQQQAGRRGFKRPLALDSTHVRAVLTYNALSDAADDTCRR
jgi:hypothetical protein